MQTFLNVARITAARSVRSLGARSLGVRWLGVRSLSAMALGLSASALSVTALPAAAQDYPAKPIRFIVPFPPGSGIDTMSRVLLDELRKNTGATFVVDNRAGAIGTIGADAAAKATADGYTIMVSSSATHSSGPQLLKSVPYDPIRDFTHMARLNTFDVAMMVNPTQGLKTLAEFVAEAKKYPDKLTYGYGSGTAQVIAAAFNRAAGVAVRAIPYKGQPLALNDLLGGQIHYVMADLAVSLPHARSGRLVALAVASPKRSVLLPDVPTFAELGVRDMELQGWVGIAAPAGVPNDVVQWWSRHTNGALARKEFLDRLTAIAVEGAPMPVDQFNVWVREQLVTWGRRIKEAGIVAE